MIEDMTRFESPEYDDECYSSMSKLRVPVTEGHMYGFYQYLAGLVSGLDKFLDLGCGSGNFEQVIPVGKIYTGVDHCSEALSIARKHTLRDRPHFIEYGIEPFMVALDLRVFDTFVFIEVLEHIKDDTGILNLVPKGKWVMLTVPNYYSGGHVRYFDSLSEVVDRYSMLTPSHTEEYEYRGSMFYIILGVKK